MLRQLTRYLVKLCKDILKIYTTLYEKWNHASGDKLVASFIWCIVYCKIFRLPQTWNATFMSSTFYFWPPQRHFNAQQMLPKNYVELYNCNITLDGYLQTHVHNSRYSMLCFASNSNKISLLFLSNWTTVEFPNFQGQLWQKTISHWIWNFHVKIWRISKWMFCT